MSFVCKCDEGNLGEGTQDEMRSLRHDHKSHFPQHMPWVEPGAEKTPTKSDQKSLFEFG